MAKDMTNFSPGQLPESWGTRVTPGIKAALGALAQVRTLNVFDLSATLWSLEVWQLQDAQQGK